MSWWTNLGDERLRGLWAEGLTTVAIAARLGVTKGSVVGRVHRLGLPSRPSPIRRLAPGETPSRRTRRRRERAAAPCGGGGVRMPGSVVAAGEDAPRPAPPPAPPREAPPRPATTGRVQPCCWPIGEPRTRGFRYCDAPSLPGRVYCAEHHARAVVPLRGARAVAELAA